MKWFDAARARARLLFARRSAESRMEEEMGFHVDMEAERLIREGGVDAGEARRRALVAFGGADRYREELRDERGGAWLGGMSLDFRLGFRMLRKYPGLTLVGTLALAFAIAVGAFGYELIGQLANPTLPFEDGGRIVAVRTWDASDNWPRGTSVHDFALWRDEVVTLRDVGAYRTVSRNMATGTDDIAPVEVAEISASAFSLTGVQPLLGRTLVPEDERPSAPPVVVIGYDVWQTRLAGDPHVVGRSVRLGETQANIAGVMPAGFAFPFAHDVWTPLRASVDTYERGAGPELTVFGRLAEGVSLEQAQAELSAIGERVAADYPDTNEHLRPQVKGYPESFLEIDLSAPVRTGLYSTNLLFLLFLALISANVAALVFARTATRESEIIVRNALGASRRRIVAQLFIEALVVAGMAAPLGLALAAFSLRWIMSVMSASVATMPFWFSDRLSAGSIAFALVLTLLGAAIAGIAPGLRVTRGLGSRLRQVSAGAGGLKLGRGATIAIVGQVAVTIIFVSFAIYAVVRASQIRTLDMGFEAQDYLSARVEMEVADGGEAAAATEARRQRAFQQLERRLAAEPGVAGVTFATRLPGAFHGRLQMQVDEALIPADSIAEHRVQAASVAIDFFDALGAPILEGRNFHSGDTAEDVHVAIVNPSFVQHVLSGRNAIGRRARFRSRDSSPDDWSPWYEIVGVAEEVALTNDPELPNSAGFYVPMTPGESRSAYMAVHVRGEPESLAPRLRPLAAAADPLLQVTEILPLDEVAHAELPLYAFWVQVLILASGMAMLLALAAIYAVMSFTVSRRTREIGIRVALGAERRRIIAATLGRHMGHAALGVVIGVGLLVAASGGIRSLRAAAFVAAFTVIMMAVILLAAIVPVRRALSIQPAEALKGSD